MPSVEPMTLDTIFDLASLTKVVATTTAVMQLVEDGRLRLADRVSAYVPGFERYGKDRITIRHLLTHASGLRPDLELAVPFEGEGRGDSRARSRKCRSPRLASASSTPTSTSSCSAHIVEQRQRRAARRLRARRTSSRRSGCSDTTFLPPAVAASRASRRRKRAQPLGWPCGTARRGDAARRRARSDREANGRRRRACGPLLDRRRPVDLRADAARRRHAGTARAFCRR